MDFIKKHAHLIIVILGSIFVSLSIFHENIWFDEAYSVAIVKHSFSEIWTIGGNDVHPILYYWLLKIIGICTGYSILAYRIFSCIPIIILGVLGYTHIRKDFGTKVGMLFTFLVFFLPVTAVYVNQIRMYSWAILSVTILSIYGYRIYKGDSSNKNIIIFGLSSLFSIYTHYYGLMAAGIINLLLLGFLIKAKRKNEIIKILVSGVIQAICYIPWMINFVTQLSNVSKGFWIGFEYPKTMVELTSFEMLGNSINKQFGIYQYVLFTLSIEMYIYAGIKLHKLRKENVNTKASIIATIIYFAVIIAAILITAIMRTSILYYRYLFVITGLYIFILSFVLSQEKNKYVLSSICLIVLIFGLVNNIQLIDGNYNKKNDEPLNYLKENVKEDETIVYSEIGIGAITDVLFENNKQFFYNSEHWGVEEAYKAFGPQMKTCEDDTFLEECSDRIWVVGYGDTAYNLLFNNENYIKLEEKDFDTTYQGDHYKIMLIEKVK